MKVFTHKVIGGKFRKLLLSSSDFENGKKIGLSGKKYIRQILARDRKFLDAAKKEKSELVDYLGSKMQAKYPKVMQELKGMAEGAGVSFGDIFLENCPELLKKEDGCTSAFIKTRERIFLIHNEDEEGWRNERGFAILNYQKKNFSYSAFSYPAELCGNAFGWNSAGLFYSVNYLATNKINLKGTPRYFIARQLVEKKTIAEAVKFLKSADDASGFHYLIGETKTGKAVSIEKSLKKISVKPAGSLYVHTNHYIHQKFKNLEQYQSSSSAVRLEIIKKRLNKDGSIEDVIELFRTSLLRPLNKKDDSQTFATVVFKLSGDKLSK